LECGDSSPLCGVLNNHGRRLAAGNSTHAVFPDRKNVGLIGGLVSSRRLFGQRDALRQEIYRIVRQDSGIELLRAKAAQGKLLDLLHIWIYTCSESEL